MEAPEFAQSDKLRRVFSALENRAYLGELVGNVAGSGTIQIFIGHENSPPDMSEVSLVLAPYGRPGPGDRRRRGPRADPDELRPGDRHGPIRVRADERTGGPPLCLTDAAPAPQERVDEIDVSPTALLAMIETLTAERDAATKVSEDYLVALQRERAEFLNFKRRTAEERDRDLGLAAEDLIRKVLVLADDFDRAIEARPASIAEDPWFEGIAAIDRKLRLLLESEGVTSIDATPGTPFDPREHEAIANVARHRPARGRDRRDRPTRVSTARPRPAAGPRGRRRAAPHRQTSTHPDHPRTLTRSHHDTWARSSASTSARPTRSSPSWRAASRPSSRTPRAAGRSRPSSRSPRPASASSARSPSARPSPTPKTPSISIKRFMGRKFDDAEVKAAEELVPYKVEKDPKGDGIGVKLADGKDYTPPEISAMILQKLKTDAEA